MRKINGGGGSGAAQRPSPSPSPSSQSIPRSGIVRGDASGPASEASSVSSSRRGSRGRDSGEWIEREEKQRRVSRHDEEEGEEGDERLEGDGDEEEQPSLHRYAKPTRSPTRPSATRAQQPTMSTPALRVPSTPPMHPSTAGGSSRPSTVSPSLFSSSSDPALMQRVAELEAQVASLEKQQRLFLAFMETTQAQLLLMRGATAQSQPQPQRSSQPHQSMGRGGGASEASRKESAPLEAQRARKELEGRREEEKRRVLEQREEDNEEEEAEDDEGEDQYGERHRPPQPQSSRRTAAAPSPLPPPSRGRPPSQPSTDGDGPTHRHSRHPSAVQTAQRRSGGAVDGPSTPLDRSSSQQRAPSRSPPPSSSPRPPPPASASSYEVESLESDPFPVVSTFPCPQCGRSFNESALAKHVAKAVCQRTRRPFDVKAQRLGEVVAELARVQTTSAGDGRSGRGKKEEKVSKWRQERARLQEAIQAGKAIEQALKEGKSLTSIPVAVSSLPDDRVQCPHCLRKFAEHSADRHIPHCKNRNARLGNTHSAVTGSSAQRRR